MFVTLQPGLRGSLLHDTIADNISSIDWATVNAVRLNVECGMLKPGAFGGWGQIHNETSTGDNMYPVVSVIPSVNGTIGNATGPGPDTIMVSVELSITPNEWSSQWSPGGPNKMRIEAQYAQGPLGSDRPTGFNDTSWVSPSAPGGSGIRNQALMR